MIIPAHVPSTGVPERTSARSGSASPSRSMPSVIVVDSPPGITSPSSPSRSAGTRTSRTSAPSSRSIRACAAKSPCRASTPTSGALTSRGWRAAAAPRACASRATSSPRPAPRRPARRARRPGSASWPRRSRRRACAGSSDLKMPEPTNTPSAPSCIISDASAGVAMPPAQNSTTGSLPASATPRTRSSGDCSSLAAVASSASSSVPQAADLRADPAHVAHGLDDVAGPGLALGADHRRALADAPQRLAEVGRAAHERDLERPLVDVVGLVGRRQDLGLVDVVDLERLEHLRLGEVADARLGHHRDRHGLLDALDHQRDRTCARRRRRGGCRRARARAP